MVNFIPAVNGFVFSRHRWSGLFKLLNGRQSELLAIFLKFSTIPFRPNKKNMCVSSYRPSLSLSHRPWVFFLLLFLVFYNWFFSQKNVFSFKSVFVATYIKTKFTKSVFVTFARCRQHVSRDQTVSQWKWSSNEPWHHVTDWKYRYTSSVFNKKYFKQI